MLDVHRSTFFSNQGRVAESGLRHSTRNRAWGNPPWVRIPPLPPAPRFRCSARICQAFDDDESRSILGGMKAFHLLSFLCGATAMLGMSSLSGSNAESPHHV